MHTHTDTETDKYTQTYTQTYTETYIHSFNIFSSQWQWVCRLQFRVPCALSKSDVFYCLTLTMWLLWMGQQTQTKYSFHLTKVLKETPLATALHPAKEYHCRPDHLCRHRAAWGKRCS